MKKRFVQLNDEQLRDACAQLAAKVTAAGFEPDIIVGIPTAGRFVAREMCLSFTNMVKVIEMTARRQTTAAKSGNSLRKVLRSLPSSIQQVLRAIELTLLTSRLPRGRTVETSAEAIETLQSRQSPKVLVVDDSVDTGASMSAVVAEVLRVAPNALVKTAALARSLPQIASPTDFVLYPNAMIQGPWSADARATTRA